MGLANIFGVSGATNYVQLKDKVYLIGGSGYTQGDVDILKRTFPSEGESSPAIICNKVLFPEPELP